MNANSHFNSTYQVGGSLPVDAPSYVVRSSDDELYNLLLKGEFCYVLNSRQMGKSSLRVQTMKRLEEADVACATIDIQEVGTLLLSPEKWYGALSKILVKSFDLEEKFNHRDWWKERENIAPVQCFGEFIEEILLREVNRNIVIFIDEIDSVLRLKFKDDFFALIRACYNKRAERPDYKRLSFALLGVATPSDLIQDKERTPFNVGRAIELHGFQLDDKIEPLAEGLKGKVRDAKAVLKEVLAWTGGQPFLTQKVCQLIGNAKVKIPHGGESDWVEKLVKTYIIDNWQTEDDPQHLRTIRERLLSNKQRTGRWLGLYQQILQKGAMSADDSPEQIELRLSGLVVKQNGNLKAYNRIYEAVFNLDWVEKELADLRPYAESITAWSVSGYRDKSSLLRGQILQNAKEWAADKSLGDVDYQFLAASQELEKQGIQIALDAERRAKQILLAETQGKVELALEKERQANRRLAEAQRKTKQQMGIGVTVLIISLLGAVSVVIGTKWEVSDAESQLTKIKEQKDKAEQQKNNAEEDKKRLEGEKSRLEKDKNLLEKDKNKLNESVKSMSRRYRRELFNKQQAQIEAKKARQEKQTLQNVNKDLFAKERFLKQSINIAQTKIKEKEGSILELGQQFTTAQKEAQTVRMEAQVAREEKQNVETELLNTQAQVEEYLRTTAPVINQLASQARASMEKGSGTHFNVKINILLIEQLTVVNQKMQDLANQYGLPIETTPTRLNVSSESIPTSRDWIVSNSLSIKKEIQGLLQKGFEEYEMSQFLAASQSLEKALILVREVQNYKAEVLVLTNLGLIYVNLKDYQKAIDLYQQALAISEEIGDRPAESSNLNNLGAVYANLGEYQKAIDLYQQALAISEEIGDRHAESSNLNNLGAVYVNLGEYQKAIDLYQQALAISEEIDDRHAESSNLNNLGAIHANLGEYQKAIDLYQQALAISEEIGDRHAESSNLNGLAALYSVQDSVQGNYAEAELLYQEALAIRKEQLGDNHPDTAISLNNLALLYKSQGRYAEAELLYQESLIILKQQLGDNHPNVASSLNNLAGLYQKQGEYTKAEPLLQKSLAIRKQQLGDNHPDVAQSLNNLAELYQSQGEYTKAEPLLQKSLAIRKERLGDNHPDVAQSLNNLALLHLVQGRYTEATPLLQESLTIRKQQLGDNHPDVATSLKLFSI